MILQLNLNHCGVAPDLLMQIVREPNTYLELILEPYRHLVTQPLETDNTTKAVIWSCRNYLFQRLLNGTEDGSVVSKIEGIHF